MDNISKATKISSWDDLKKTREVIFEIDEDRSVKLRGVTEGERRKAVQDCTETRFDKQLKEDIETINEEELAYRLIMVGWVEPEIPGETFEQKKEEISNLGYAILQNVASKINELSGLNRKDIEDVKNDLGHT